ncbi:hypothetical protein [Fusibacter sp. JL216-2]|uniref:hypothetical protein n=1 Tax=Fusibacter sp. JL216-2 TaxID=3071453 RepID=UPI003D34CCDD
MKPRRIKMTSLIGIAIMLVLITAKYGLIINDYKEAKYELGFSNWTRSMHPFYSSTETIDFIVDGSQDVVLKTWWEGLSGDVELMLCDEAENEIFKLKSKKEHNSRIIALENGKYKLSVTQDRFTGAVAIGYENVTRVIKLDDQYYTFAKRKPDKGFNWDYILYVPEHVKYNKLLVSPNNSGIVSDNYDIHIEKAKSLIKFKSELAEKLGVPLLVPIFPRSRKDEGIYTHALDRNSIYTVLEEIKRLDYQLISIIEDSKERLKNKGITVEEKILMSGFSASGDFVDRFVFLHPEIVEAASIGASDTIVPIESLRGQKLPYPIGIYDYEKITGEEFDLKSVSSVRKLIYKGSDDGGGWQTVEEEGVTVRYIWKDYYEKYLLPILRERSILDNEYSVDSSNLSQDDLNMINFKAFDGKILIERFREISEIYSELNIHRTEFKIYENIEHTINDEIKQDEFEFFKNVLSN